MSSDIRSRSGILALPAAWLSRLASNGWQENAQFIGVCVFVLVLHLIAAPVLKRAAANPEPADSPRGARPPAVAMPAANVTRNENAGKSAAKAPIAPPASLIFKDSAVKGAPSTAVKAVPAPVIPSTEPLASQPRPSSAAEPTAAETAAPKKSAPQLTDLIGPADEASPLDGPPAVKLFRTIQ